jgi:prepilin-type N-terminal cleavage/methylation domain-containing protein
VSQTLAAIRKVWLRDTRHFALTGNSQLAGSRSLYWVERIMKRQHEVRAAFSLMELLAVVTILGIIAAMVLSRVMVSTDNAKEQTCYHNRAEVNIAVEQWYIHTGTWPANDLSDIGVDTNYFPEGPPTCPVTGAPYAVDAVNHRVIGHTGPGTH